MQMDVKDTRATPTELDGVPADCGAGTPVCRGVFS